MFRVILILALLTLTPFHAAQADEAVAARLAPHGAYSRLVFNWPSPTTYTIQQETGGSLLVTFPRPGTLDAAGVASGDANVTAVSSVSAAGTPLSVRVASSPGGHFRDFSIGNRVIIDVYGQTQAAASPSPAAAPITLTPSSAAPPKIAAAPKKKTPDVPVKNPPAKKAPVKDAAAVAPIMPAASPEPIPAAPVKTASETNTITLSATEQSNMAAFIRNGNLWLVLDRADITVPPTLTGPHPEKFSPFRRVDIKGGVGFVTRMPDNADLEVYGEGGGLIWRLVVTPQARDVHPAALQRNFPRDKTKAGITAFWPLQGATKILDVQDPDVGDTLKVAPVAAASQFAGPGAETVDFTALRSPIGLAIAPKVDDLIVKASAAGVDASRPEGLALSPQKDISLSQMRMDVAQPLMVTPAPPIPVPAKATTPGTAPATPMRRIFDFEKWQMGGLQAVEENQRILMAGLNAKDQDGQVQDLLTMAKMDIANDRGEEAIGFLDYAADTLPAIADTPEYKALRGAAEALSGKYELALDDLNAPELKPYSELDYWRAYTLAALEDWQQAHATLPADQTMLLAYPPVLLQKLGLKIAEISLHAGDVKTAETMLGVMEHSRATYLPGTVAGMDYLEGEADSQKGKASAARDLWTPLTTGKDPLYRVKGGLALTTLQLQKGDITRAQAIDRLEGLRYMWRGDELEARVNYLLGKLYLEDKAYMKGIGILKDAAAMSPDTDIAKEINAYLADAYKTLLMTDKNISPLDAATVYEEFPELIPSGDDGDKMAQRLAERLVEADLLPRAANLLQHQVDARLHGADQARVATRLAAIYLLDKDPQKAIPALDVAEGFYSKQTDADSKAALRRVQLMRARALSQMNRTQDALAMLAKFPPDPDVNSLRADIAWQAGLWDQAASALQDMIIDQGVDPAKPLTQKQADLILNRAVALNLSANHVALANLRQRYQDAMSKTSRAKLFDVISSPRESPLLSDKQTLEALVSEVDIFKDFLDSYRAGDDPDTAPAKAAQ